MEVQKHVQRLARTLGVFFRDHQRSEASGDRQAKGLKAIAWATGKPQKEMSWSFTLLGGA